MIGPGRTPPHFVGNVARERLYVLQPQDISGLGCLLHNARRQLADTRLLVVRHCDDGANREGMLPERDVRP